MGIVKSVEDLIRHIHSDLENWGAQTKPWFRGESDNSTNNPEYRGPLCPEIAAYDHNHENHILQSFRRQAGGLANVPSKEYVDYWLMLAQHYCVPTRLLDWTEGALHALYFAINRADEDDKPRVYMLNPRKLNALAGVFTFNLNYPLVDLGNPNNRLAAYFRLAWNNRFLDVIARVKQPLQNLATELAHIDSTLSEEIQRYADTFPDRGNPAVDPTVTLSEFAKFKAFEVREKLYDFVNRASKLYKNPDKETVISAVTDICLALPPFDMSIPIAFPATYQDQRMIAQRSCFTIHGDELKPIPHILSDRKIRVEDYLTKYDIDIKKKNSILKELAFLGISAATIFPDLDHLAEDLTAEICYDLKIIKPDKEC